MEVYGIYIAVVLWAQLSADHRDGSHGLANYHTCSLFKSCFF